VPLEVLDEQHRRAAIGYVELGMYLEADAELDKIDPLCRAAPEVLQIRFVSITSDSHAVQRYKTCAETR
jgi:hypothetical protein